MVYKSWDSAFVQKYEMVGRFQRVLGLSTILVILDSLHGAAIDDGRKCSGAF